MTRLHIISVCGCIYLAGAASAVQAQAFVNQATPPTGGSVYVDQVPPGAKPRPAQAPAARASARRQAPQAKASTVEEVSSTARLMPTVGTGSSAIIRLTSNRDWPSVGGGTVRK